MAKGHMKQYPYSLLVVFILCACSSRKGGISNIQPLHDSDRPHIEYRVVEIEGTRYVATRAAHWPGGGEKWDLVGLKP